MIYDDADERRSLAPTSCFFGQRQDGSVVADIVDPHGWHLADSLPKPHRLARHAEANGNFYGRIEAVSEVDGRYRLLDPTNPDVRAAVYGAASAKAAYTGPLSAAYS